MGAVSDKMSEDVWEHEIITRNTTLPWDYCQIEAKDKRSHGSKGNDAQPQIGIG